MLNFRDIAKEVTDNHNKLLLCRKPHDFSIKLESPAVHFGRYQCTKCGGCVYAVNKYWYEEGLEDSRQDSK